MNLAMIESAIESSKNFGLVRGAKNAVKSRHSVIFWWGNCSYSQLKVTYEVRKMLCPLCQHPLVDAEYLGNKIFAKDRNALDYVRDSWMPAVEDGVEVWRVIAEVGGRKPCKSFSS
jgi:hypothetical protein